MRFRRGRDQDDAANACYVHLTNDGAIFVVRGDGTQDWITRRQLDGELRALKASGGTLLYSRDDPAGEPSPMAFATFRAIVEHELPIKLVDEPHPDVASLSSVEAGSLMAFAYLGADELVEDLLVRGADPAVRDRDGYTALMYAANRGADGCARILLAHGAEPNDTDTTGNTALMFAAQHGHTAVVEHLLDAGADVNRRGQHGLTAVGLASQNGHETTVAMLSDAGGQQ